MSSALSVLVCRGCCCGTAAKHPLTDHDAQVDALRQTVARVPGARLRVVDCVDQCSRSNVVVVRRRDGGGSTWFGYVLSALDTKALAAWIEAGGPGVEAVPFELEDRVFTPSATAVGLARRNERRTDR
jgi:predicted metal-binding protein